MTISEQFDEEVKLINCNIFRFFDARIIDKIKN